ncbi:Plasma membrane t-SNARE, secretory vesicle fusion [Podochytrium sp. JEL0797]|nr:Plasma membrane t-SNARE, secretory vesicle fusion [Podochytrium sp. JEL0797]
MSQQREREQRERDQGPRYPPASSSRGGGGPPMRQGSTGWPQQQQRDQYPREQQQREQYPRQQQQAQRSNSRMGSTNSGGGVSANGRDRLADLQRGSPAGSQGVPSYDRPAGSMGRGLANQGGSMGRAPSSASGSAFFDQVDSVRSDLDRMHSSQLPSLAQLHQRIIAATNHNDQAQYTRQADQIQASVQATLQSVRKTVRQLAAQNANLPPGAESHSRKGQLGTLAKKLMAVADEFQNIQRNFKNKYKQRMEREIRIARPDATPQEIARALDSASGSAFSQQLLSSRNDKQRRALEEVQDRHTELQKIERSLTELFDLFQEMQQLIEVQQEMINNVESNVENTVAYMEEGSKELTKAIVYRKKTRKRQWWIWAIVLVLLAIIGVAVYIEVIKPLMNH